MSSAATDKTSLGYKLWLKFFGDKANRKNIQNTLSVEPPSDTELTALLGVDSQGHTILRKKVAADTIADQSLYEAQSSVALSYQDSEGDTHTVLFADSSGIVDPFIFKGVIDCALNPNYPAADAGHVYKVSVAGKIGGVSGKAVTAGDTLYCFTDSSAAGDEATVGANWAVLQVNISEMDYVRNHVYYVDGSRTDSYTADGSIYRPYTTIKAAQDAINVVSATLLGTAANYELCKFIVKIAPGKYTDNIAISTARYIRYDMEGVEISGNITITQNQVGLTDYYGKVEFFGGHGNRAYRGNCGLISGNVTFLKDAYDSLAYDAFIGIHISGNVQYGTSSAATHGTWVLCLINSYFSSSSKYISEYLTDATEGVLIESYGYNKILSKLAKQDNSATKITLYDCNNTYFGTVNITPTENGVIKNCTFNTTTSIVALKTLYLDSNSHKSLLAQTPTVTGMTLTGLDMGMAHQEANAVTITGGTITGVDGTFTALASASATLTGGTANNVAIGGSTPAAGAFSSMTTSSATITGGTINSTAIGGTTPANGTFNMLSIPEKTPVNAVAASRVLTVNATPGEGETVVIADNTYKMRLTALGAGEYASAVLTNDETAPADGDTATIGTTVYRFKTVPEQANDIFLGTATATMLSLFKAIHLTGEVGVDYYTGTTAIDIAATAVHTSTFVITVTANAKGYAGNLFAKAESSDHLDWDGETAFFTGGIDPEAANDVFVDGTAEHAIDNLVLAITAGAGAGTKYGTGTVVHPTVTAVKASSSTMTATAKTKGVAGNSIVIGETLADVGSVWADGETTLGGGVDGTVGVANEICADATYLYHCVATNTISDNNWRQIALGSAY